MSCEKFEHAAQNKRYLGDLVDKLVAEAKDDSDMFEDIPLDFRHHKPRSKPQFPEEWKMTKSRAQELETLRQVPPQQFAQIEQEKVVERQRGSEAQRRIAEYAMAQPLGRRQPTATRSP
jgi:small subunit ribosomal protein S35